MQFDSNALTDPFAPFPATSTQGVGPQADAGEAAAANYVPPPIKDLDEAGLSTRQVGTLIVAYLLNEGVATGRQIARGIALPFGVVEPVLQGLKDELQLVLKGATPLGDYCYELSSAGQEHARRGLEQGAYSGPAPVPLAAYRAGVARQSVRRKRLRLDDIRTTMADLVLSDELVAQLGEAVHLGLGFLLFGDSGNGKTSVAKRIMNAFGDTIWIPYAVDLGGETVQLLDPHYHQTVESEPSEAGRTEFDPRWVRIERPAIVVAGQLGMDQFEIVKNPITGVSQAPLQMKSNCGALVIDDLGCQPIRSRDVLNRWIAPLERRADLLCTTTGQQVRVPFDQLVIFSSSAVPARLGDDAFLRRIPFKIHLQDPTDAQYRRVARRLAHQMQLECSEEMLDLLVVQTAGRPRRFGHVSTLFQLIGNHCDFHQLPRVVTGETIAAAVASYFGA